MALCNDIWAGAPSTSKIERTVRIVVQKFCFQIDSFMLNLTGTCVRILYMDSSNASITNLFVYLYNILIHHLHEQCFIIENNMIMVQLDFRP